MVGKEKTVNESRADQVCDISFPQHTSKRWIVRRIFVLRRFADRANAAYADDDAPRLLGERCPFSVEKAQRFLGAQRAEERVQHRKLIATLLYPGGFDLLS